MDKCLDSIKLCALRVTDLDALGNVAAGPNNFVAFSRELTFGWTPDNDAGKDLFYRDGCDRPLATYKSPTLTKRYTTAIGLFGLEPAATSLMLGATVVDDADGDVIGFEDNIQTCPTDPTPALVAVEAWSYAWNCDQQDPDTPWWYHLFPMTQWNQDQENLLQTDFLQPHLAGFTRKNSLWGHGPYGGVVKGAAGGDPFLSNGSPAHFLTSTDPPADFCGFQTVVPGS